MLRAFKHLNKSSKTEVSIRLLILILVCGILEGSVSTLSAEELHVYPGSLVFNAVQGHALSGTRSLFIFSSQETTINWSQSRNGSWLTTDLTSGTTNGVLKVGVNTSGLTAGVYNGTVTVQSAQSTIGPIVVQVTLIVNPDVPVQLTTWKDGYSGAMSVSVDDTKPSGFTDLSANGFSGTYVLNGTNPPSFFTDYYNAGMELGCHTVSHICNAWSDDVLRHQELEPNILALAAYTPEPQSDIITFVWPCGFTNYREESVAPEYFLSSRGYNINQLEDQVPDNFMNLKSFNSHEHTPYPPADLKTVVDDAINQKKWFNVVLHVYSNDDGAINYAHSNDIWVSSIGSVIKYILQRERFILSDYGTKTDSIGFKVSRTSVPSSIYRSFETAFGPNDLSTVEVDVNDTRAVQYVKVDGINNSYQIKDINGNKVLLVNVKLEPGKKKTVEVKYLASTTIGLTISGVTAKNKVYNGTSAATLNTARASLVGVTPGDVVTLISSGAAGTFNNKNAGNSKTVVTSGFALSGPDAGKYTLITPTPLANITRANLTVSGVTANDKVYDGTILTTINTGGAAFSGLFPGDVVTLVSSGAAGVFSDKNIGSGKTITISGLTTGGKDGFNYTLTQPVSSADITTASLTITGLIANSRAYNNTTVATLNTGGASLSGVFGSDIVALNSTSASGTFNNRNVGTGKLVVTTGFSLTGNDADNYTLTNPALTANLTPAILTISGVTSNGKVYNATTTATLNTGSATLNGIYAGDAVTLITAGAKGTFADKNAGTGKPVSTSGFTLGGTDSGNYTLTQPSTTATITTAPLTVTGITANNKVYNGTTSATLNTAGAVFSGVFSGDVVTIVASGATGTFADKNRGTAKSVTITGLSAGGTDGANYTLTQPSGTANITPATVIITGVNAGNKIYNGTTSVVLNTSGAALSGVFGPDVVTLNSSAVSGVFVNKNAGTGKTVIVTGFTIGGTDSDNYTITQPSVTANISTAALTVIGVTAVNKVYNALATASLNTSNASIVGVYAGDAVNLITAGTTGTFADKNAGSGKTVSSGGFALGGTDAANYTVIQPASIAEITKAPLTVTGITAVNRVYNATTSATLNTGSAALSGVFSGDVVTLVSAGATGTFANKNVGTGIPVTISGFTTGGADGGNYILAQPSATANITPAPVTVTGITAGHKFYDATTGAIVNPGSASLTGVFTGDVVTLIGGVVNGSFNNKNAGISKTVTISGYSISGSDAGNYHLTQPVANANINPIALTVTGVTATSRAYNGTTTAALNNSSSGLSGVLSDDDVVLLSTGASGTFANKTTGTGKVVLTSGYTLGGADAFNYTVMQPSLMADITKAAITITGAQANSKVYDGTTLTTLNNSNANLSGVLSGDIVNLHSNAAIGNFVNKNTGANKLVSASGYSLLGSDADNYILTQPVLAANITPKSLTIIANSFIKHFKTTFTFSGNEFTANGLVQGDVISGLVFSSAGSIASAAMGTYPILVSGGTNSNYNFSYVNGVLTVGKSKLFASADSRSKIYGSANPVFTITYSGFFSGDDASMLDLPPLASSNAISTSDAGAYAITLSGGSDHNYDLVLTNGVLTIEKATLTVIADNKTRPYKEANPDFTISYSGFIAGQDQGVLDVLPVALTDADVNSDAGTYDINVSGGSDLNYTISYNKGTLNITKADQHITFDPIPARLRMTQESRLAASSTSGLPVSFETSDPTIGIVEGDTLKVKKEGHLTISAIQKGDHNWNEAQDVSQIIETLPTFDGISSLFTPNNDGMNDYWYIPELEQYGKLQVTVYNRFGQAVYRSDSYKNDWDGTWNGSPLPSASYYYIIRSSARGFIKGVVNIVR